MNTIRYFFLFTSLFLFTTTQVKAQCPAGAVGVSGSGCGCLSGCNLTSLGGPNCGGTSGNCSAGQVSMSIDITVPSGCTYTVTATMANRGGTCSASGADSGDKMKVDLSGGSKVYQTGTSNATLNDSYTLIGPGTIQVSGTANRADEIITYTTTSSGCINCSSSLPIELTAFGVKQQGEYAVCSWQTETERNNDYFTVERSADGIVFEPVAYTDGAGNSMQPLTYTMYDSSPLYGLSYYRLKQTDFNGLSTYSQVQSLLLTRKNEIIVYPNPSNGDIYITAENVNADEMHLYTTSGQEIALTLRETAPGHFYCDQLEAGVYILQLISEGEQKSTRITVIRP